MSDKSPYSRFIEHMRSWAIGLPESEVLIPLLQTRLTPEESEFLADLPFLPIAIEQLTEQFKTPIVELSARLDPLATRGLLFRHESKDTIRYALNDSVFIFYRSPFWAGRDDDSTQKLATLANQYLHEAMGAEYRSYPTSVLRALPVETGIKDERKVLPYEDVVQILESEDYFCTSTCPCRHRKNLDPNASNCKHETFNCLHFGRLAQYMVRNGMGKEITREETMDILRAAAEAGLVHGIGNLKERSDTICNCCSCCCIFLEPLKNPQVQKSFQPSNYMVEMDTESCKGCGLCVKRCPMGALELVEKLLRLKPDLCIGCGVCAYKCPTQSLGLVHREKEQDFPLNGRDWIYRMGMERGRDPFAADRAKRKFIK
ncbi:MAG: 4Fe-4S binding protein [Candidatus Tectomicrobia bacterium]|uniref:4Fe-4S binding protein n=1 Tax=Tectimicrobiota bacterium TaxID=2528274 RepID=A0A933GPI3_UNCTE|nr:4Fe-4S binding protein [Candidatus Tectomicrobia bacterium]